MNNQENLNEQLRIAVCTSGSLETIKKLVMQGADCRYNDNLLLKMACQNGHVEKVKCLLELGSEIDNKTGSTIMFAIHSKSIDVVKLLVESGASIFIDKNAPIRYASSLNRHDMILHFLDLGADIKLVEKHANTEVYNSAKNYVEKKKLAVNLEENLNEETSIYKIHKKIKL